MIDKDALAGELLKNEGLMTVLRSDLSYIFSPIRMSHGYGFDLQRETTFQMPDSMHLRTEQLIHNYVHYIVDALLPKLRKEASDEAKHNLIRKLGQVLN